MDSKYSQTTKLTITFVDDEIEDLLLLLRRAEDWRAYAEVSRVDLQDTLEPVVDNACNEMNGTGW